MQLHAEDVLFVGLGKSVPNWYRCALPAYHLGANWIGYSGRPPKGDIATGNTMSHRLKPGEAKVFVVQQPRGREWKRWIDAVHNKGGVVLYEVDDNLHGTKALANAATGDSIPVTKDILDEYEMCMKESDGIICSTPWLARYYGKFNRTWVCQNGIDIQRFGRQRPEREQPTIGWFGGAGHEASLELWAPVVTKFCNERGLRFFSCGQKYDCWNDIENLTHIPFVSIEAVPDVLANVDIGLAPWADDPFYWGKSDLRWLEGAAAGVAMIVDPRGYPESTHNKTALHAGHDFLPWSLWDALDCFATQPDFRSKVVSEAALWAGGMRSSFATSDDWEQVLTEISKEL